MRLFAWLRNPALRIGVLTGVYLSIVLGAWLVIANRIPWSANFALTRNLIAGALFLLLMLIPIGRFLRSPARLFASGLAGWALFAFTYLVMGFFFERLHSRKGSFEVLILGAAVYGVVAVAAWVVSLVLAARHHPIAASRRRSS
jgi:hypothetical protein